MPMELEILSQALPYLYRSCDYSGFAVILQAGETVSVIWHKIKMAICDATPI
jgi:hypothetical protein